ncbi:LysR family transcriptional regulator [Tupanvirus soda lake]|uniref:LysR family transcriptional regulator n=2 Tax=Tupanvirus TaxID=2094720 RepID=A0A6N1NZI2_9VIRU|nr:LysR family transcriptional regulator [Tupanvirus soda lake]QKU35332.1 LysR family transcriptional regulator [Tupanvirus soda lake]
MAIYMPLNRNYLTLSDDDVIFDDTNRRMLVPLDDASIILYKQIQQWVSDNSKDKTLLESDKPELINDKYIWIDPIVCRGHSECSMILDVKRLVRSSIFSEETEKKYRLSLNDFLDIEKYPYWINPFDHKSKRWIIDIGIVPKLFFSKDNPKECRFIMICEIFRIRDKKLIAKNKIHEFRKNNKMFRWMFSNDNNMEDSK